MVSLWFVLVNCETDEGRAVLAISGIIWAAILCLTHTDTLLHTLSQKFGVSAIKRVGNWRRSSVILVSGGQMSGLVSGPCL